MTIWQDIRYSFRMLTKSPGFTAIALITLAIGIGANTIMFSVVDALLLRPVNVKDPHQLVGCHSRVRVREWSRYADFSYSSFVQVRDSNPVFSGLLAFSREMVAMEQKGVTRRSLAAIVSANYFSTLGMPPIRGRSFLPDEEQPGTEPVVILSYRAWRQHGADPEIIGKQVCINGQVCRIVGVAQEGFTGTTLLGPDIWLPLGVYRDLCSPTKGNGAESSVDQDYPPKLNLVGRLKPGLSMSAAYAQLQPLAANLEESFPQKWRYRTFHLARLPRMSMETAPQDDRRRLSGVSLFLMSVSAVVLLIACLNLANMQMVQGTSRHREIAIRMAMGGGRRRILRQLLIESFLLAILGGSLGLALACGGIRILTTSLAVIPLPMQVGAAAVQAQVDVRVLMGTLGFCGIAALLSGLRPAWRLSRRDIIHDLKESPRGAFRPAGKTHRVVPRGLSAACQIALSVVLVMGAGLFTHSAVKAVNTTPGYSFDGKLLLEVDPLATGYDRTRSHQVCQSLVDHLSAIPGIQAVGLSTPIPFGPGIYSFHIAEHGPESGDDTGSRWSATMNFISGDYFQSIGLPLLQGRHFSRIDSTANAAKVAIIDEPTARRLRPDGNALGCLISIGSAPHEVIGIVPGIRDSIFEKEAQPHVYVPFGGDSDLPFPMIYIVVRVASTAPGAETALLQRIPEEIRKVDPYIPVLSLTTLSDFHRNSISMWFVRIGAELATAFGAMALFLAALGIYGVKGYMVASRTPEIGIRKALGATCRDISAMVLREGATLTLVGLAVGMLLALAAARLVASVLCGVSPVDPVSICVTLLLLGGTSLLASYLPARRAAKIDPMEALRYE